MRILTPMVCLLVACEGTAPESFDPDLVSEVEALEAAAGVVEAPEPDIDLSAAVAPAPESLQAGRYRGGVACASGHTSHLTMELVEADAEGGFKGKAEWEAGGLEVSFGVAARVTGVAPGGRSSVVFDAGHCADAGEARRCPDLEEAVYSAPAESLVGHAGIPTADGVERCIFTLARG